MPNTRCLKAPGPQALIIFSWLTMSSFRDGSGTDGFVEIAALSQLHAEISVMISIYLLPLRHPLPVARQLATMHKIAPGRMLFGVGIGGEEQT